MLLTLEKDNRLTLPCSIVELLDMNVNATLNCWTDGIRIILEPLSLIPSEPHYSMAQRNVSDQPFRFSCFGSFSITYKKAPILIPSKKARELLAFLACEQAPVSKQRAADILWEDKNSVQAMDNLYKTLHLLRRKSQWEHPLPIRLEQGTMLLNQAEISFDFLEFERLLKYPQTPKRLEQAVALYKAPLLGEEAYSWIQPMTARFDCMYLEALEWLRTYYQQKNCIQKERYYTSLLEQ